MSIGWTLIPDHPNTTENLLKMKYRDEDEAILYHPPKTVIIIKSKMM